MSRTGSWKKDAATVAVWALLTMGLGLAVGWPRSSVAKGEASEIRPGIAVPTLQVKGCEVTLRCLKEAYQPGEKPVVIVTAANKSRQPAQLQLVITMWSRNDMDDKERMMSRAGPRMRPSWKGSCSLALKAEETQSKTLETAVPLRAGQIVQFSIEESRNQVTTGEVVAQSAKPTVAATKKALAGQFLEQARKAMQK
jgi:uncharacterized glyoxalase superfamily protein PhnB